MKIYSSIVNFVFGHTLSFETHNFCLNDDCLSFLRFANSLVRFIYIPLLVCWFLYLHTLLIKMNISPANWWMNCSIGNS